MKKLADSRAWLLLLMISGIGGSLLVWWVTRAGVGLQPDAAFYFSAARSFGKDGRFLMPDDTPMVTWPPGYSFALAIAAKATGDVPSAARALDMLLFSLNGWLLAGLAWRATRSRFMACAVAWLFVLSPLELGLYVSTYAEPLNLAFWLLSLHALLEYRQSGGWWFLLGSALAAGFSTICRYVGVVEVIAAAIFLLAFCPGSMGRRLRDAAIYLSVGLAPFALLMWHYLGGAAPALNAHYGWFGTHMRRSFAWYGVNLSWIKNNLIASTRWVLPFNEHNLIKVLLVILLAGLFLALWLAGRGAKPVEPADESLQFDGGTFCLFGLNLIGYTALYYLTVTVLDPYQDGGARMAASSFTFVLLLAAMLFGHRWSLAVRMPDSFARRLAPVLPGLIAAIFLYSTLQWLAHADDDLGYASSAWRQSSGLAALDKLPPSRPIYSRWLQVVYLYTGRTTHEVPMLTGVQAAKNPDFDREMSDLAKEMASNHGVLVMFKAPASRLPPLEWFRNDRDLRVLEETDDAVFFEPATVQVGTP